MKGETFAIDTTWRSEVGTTEDNNKAADERVQEIQDPQNTTWPNPTNQSQESEP